MSRPPEGYRTVIPRIAVADVAAQVHFLRTVFDAVGDVPDGRPAELALGDSMVMVGPILEREPFPAFLYVYVDDADETYRRALAAGAHTVEEPRDTPYGDRRAMVRDGNGNLYQIAHRLTQEPPEDRPERRFGWWDMFVHEDDDPRVDGGWDNNERAVLTGSLSDRRLTLELKCVGLTPEQMAHRSVPPSDLSLLGLVRHLAGVEQYWFRQVIAGEEVDRLYVGDDGQDLAFTVGADGAAGAVEEAWSTWRSEVAFAKQLVDATPDLGQLGKGRPVPLREVLVHLIREYAQHLGHADLLRERIDGRVGQ